MKTKLFELQNQSEKTSEQIGALSYALYLLKKENREAIDMVENVSTNIYYNQWKAKAKSTTEQVETLENLLNELSNEQTQTNNQIGEILEVCETLLNDLTSAYQEEAIQNAIEELKENEMTKQDFCDSACDNYRQILKGLVGFDIKDIYQGFRKFGDETELNEIAEKIYIELTK